MGSINSNLIIEPNTQDFPPSTPFAGIASEDLTINQTSVAISGYYSGVFADTIIPSSFQEAVQWLNQQAFRGFGYVRQDALKGEIAIMDILFESEGYVPGGAINIDTLYALKELNVPNGDYTIILKNGEEIEVELFNFDENVHYASDPIIGSNISDTKMTIFKYNKNLIIDENVLLTPQTRKKGLCIICNGTLEVNGEISMTSRGAIAEGQDVLLFKNSDNTYEFVPSIGAAETMPVWNAQGQIGTHGIGRQSGAGASGGGYNGASAATGGKGSAGTSYSGGTGGGATGIDAQGGSRYLSFSGSPNGGKGGNGGIYLYNVSDNFTGGTVYGTPGAYGGGAGAGNPRGTKSSSATAQEAEDGTGGLLIIYTNELKGTGKISSNGSTGGTDTNGIRYYGGGSGGGSINIFANTIIEGIEYNADGVGAIKGGSGTVTIQGFSKIKEIETNMTSNNTPPPFVASASSVFNTTQYDAYGPFKAEGSLYIWWGSAVNFDKTTFLGNEWVQIYLGREANVKRFDYKTFTTKGSIPVDWTFEGSNNGTTFEILYDMQNDTEVSTNETRSFDLTPSKKYSYFRFKVTRVKPATSPMAAVGKLTLYEEI